MTLRERLLALFREPNYSPANESELLRQLGLNKKRRASVAHEIRLLLSQGEVIRSPDNRIRFPKQHSGREPRKELKKETHQSNELRKTFTPTKRV
ncbi:MAG: 3'-5' exonuclease, partial [Opitutus sp.]